jgi:hypothetical protein
MNTTHPDAKPKHERERDELHWYYHESTGGYALIVNGNDELVGHTAMKKQTVKEIVREHNRLMSQTLDRAANVERYNRELNALEIAPNGDDYNTLLDLLYGADFHPPVATGR